MKLSEKTLWDDLTESQKFRLIKLITHTKDKFSDSRHGWIRKGLLLATLKSHGFNRKLVEDAINEIYYRRQFAQIIHSDHS